MLANPKEPPVAKSWLVRDWEQYGAHASQACPLNFDEASRYCRQLAELHYENFSIASRLIPAHLRRHFYHVYAYCRWSDDLADESSSPAEAMERLAWWQIELDACFQRQSRHPVMIALQQTVQEFSLEQQPFNNLLSAFRQDQSHTRYTDDEQLLDYCQRSANPVGRILLRMAKADSEENVIASDKICTGLQLVNFCQDMQRDARMDRIYFPKSRWLQYGVTEISLLAGNATAELQQAAIAWCRDIAEYFYQGWELTYRVPHWLARDVRLFASAGLQVVARIANASGDVWTQRIEISKHAKFFLLLRACMTTSPPKRIHFPLFASNRSVMSD